MASSSGLGFGSSGGGFGGVTAPASGGFGFLGKGELKIENREFYLNNRSLLKFAKVL